MDNQENFNIGDIVKYKINDDGDFIFIKSITSDNNAEWDYELYIKYHDVALSTNDFVKKEEIELVKRQLSEEEQLIILETIDEKYIARQKKLHAKDLDIKVEKHYGISVSTNTKTDVLRCKECLCLNCGTIKNCDTAKTLYNVCVEQNIALIVTRCPKFNIA